MSPVALVCYALHILAASAWVGGLIALAFALQRLIAEGGSAMAGLGGHVLRRFSAMGMAAVSTILLTGILNTALRISSWRDLLHSDWGAILLVKVALFWTMVALASVNRFRLMPRLAGKSGGGEALLWNCMLEFLLGLMALAAAAALGVQPPPH
jgi:putative copper resistance protein D